MPELILLSLDRVVFKRTWRDALKGDPEAERALREAWDDYRDLELGCFLCNQPTDHPPFISVVPERHRNDKLIALPLCQVCADLPSQLRLHRITKVLRAMWSKTGGPQVHFNFVRR